MRWLLPALLLALAPLAAGQTPGPLGDRPRVYVGAGLGPGVGAVAFGSDPVLGVLTREAVLYADYVPRVTGGSGRLLTAVGVGGGVRVLRVLDIAQNRDAGPLDVDLGLRVGPSFYTAFFEQTARSRSRAFAVMLDPFARATLRLGSGLGSGRVVFVEVGTQAPALRAGLSTSIHR